MSRSIGEAVVNEWESVKSDDGRTLADIVARHVREAMKAERERCAKVCRRIAISYSLNGSGVDMCAAQVADECNRAILNL